MRTLIFIKLEISRPQLIPRQLAGQTCLRTQWARSIECCCFHWTVNISNQENQRFGFPVSLGIWLPGRSWLPLGSSRAPPSRPRSLRSVPHRSWGSRPPGGRGGSAALLSCAHGESTRLRFSAYFNSNLPGLSGQRRFCCLSLLLHLERSRRWKTSRSRNAEWSGLIPIRIACSR